MTQFSSKRRAVGALLALAVAAPFTFAHADGGKPIRMVVPNAAGSSVDSLARTIGNPLSKLEGNPVVVENLPGAGGVTGTMQVVRGPKDGSTLAMVSNNHAVNPSLYKTMPFDSIHDITPITIVGTSPFVLVANPSVPAKNLKELIAYAKAKPGELTYGSSGNGTILHLAGEALRAEAGIDIKHIPYRGTGQLTTDLLGGQIQLAFLGVTGAAQYIKSGRLHAIGLSTTTPSPILPGVLPLAQQGLPNYNQQGWIALIGPAGLPAATVNKLQADIKSLLATKEVQDAFALQGFTPVGSTPAETLAQFQSDMVRYAKLVKQSGMTID